MRIYYNTQSLTFTYMHTIITFEEMLKINCIHEIVKLVIFYAILIVSPNIRSLRNANLQISYFG